MRWTLALVSMLLLTPLAHAGTEQDPEIEDALDDTTDPVPERDMGAVWVQEVDHEGEPALHFRIRVADDHDHTSQFHAVQVRYRVGFVPSTGLPDGAAEAYVYLRPSQAGQTAVVVTVPVGGDEVVSCRFGTAEEAGGSQDLDLEVDAVGTLEEANLFGCILPFSFLEGFGVGDSLTNLYVEHQLVTRGPTSGGLTAGTVPADKIPVTVLDTFDRAPDSGFGRDFVVEAEQNATEPEGNVTGNVTGNATGNTTVDEPAENGNMTVEPESMDGDGNATGDESGNETVDGADDKESPGFLLPVLMMVLIAIVRRR